jgi:heavy metal translocating P-type ATPase
MIKSLKSWILLFRYPLIIATCILAHLGLQHIAGQFMLADIATWIGTAIGSIQLLKKTAEALRDKKLALDYIAIIAILVALFGQYYLVATVIMLMLSGGYALEDYGLATAKRSLTALISRIPNDAQVWENNTITETRPVSDIKIGQHILIRKGEIIPLDGILESNNAEIDESSITGEPYLLEKNTGDQIRSGTVNIGNPIRIRVTAIDKDSTFRAIINMVRDAQLERSPMIRLADTYSFVFLGITFSLALAAYLISHDITRVLGVLVVATPCPLILATPIALMGGVSAASKRLIIVKRLGNLETLSRVQALIFDKTGTLTLGKPIVSTITLHTSQLSKNDCLSIAAAIERNSLHPLAKALVMHAKEQHAPLVLATNITEKIGHGISGTIANTEYTLSKIPNSTGMSIGLYSNTSTLLAQFEFEDKLKQDSSKILATLGTKGLRLFLFTGDKKSRAEALLKPLGLPITVEADCSPEEKKEKVIALHNQGYITAMIGDGINDAPALAASDVGLVFSHDEQTASTEAADIVLLGGDISLVLEALQIATKTVRVARQCIMFGISASIIGMSAAALGYLPPIIGAFFQEIIDIIVILYALQTSQIGSVDTKRIV